MMANVMYPRSDYAREFSFADEAEMLRWSQENPMATVMPFDDDAHYIKAGEKRTWKQTA